MDISVFEDVANFGPTEDGAPYTAPVYCVMAQDAKGNRWVHELTFPGCKRYATMVEGELIVRFENLSKIAQARAEDLASRVRKALTAGGQINFDYWVETFPAYGSEAYREEDMVVWEKEYA